MKLIQPVLGFALILFISACNNYEKDGDKVYYNSWNEAVGSSKRYLDSVNAEKFHVLEHDSYAKDDKLVFYEGDLIRGADAKTFEALSDFYAHDKFRGYYGGDSIESSNGPTFRIISGNYSTDERDVFFMKKSLKIKSIKNFRFVFDAAEEQSERWATDGKYYYIEEFKVPSEDYTHMTLYKNSGGISKDSKWAYWLDRKINYNDSGKSIIDTIDVQSFRVNGYLECSDKFGCIKLNQGRANCDPK